MPGRGEGGITVLLSPLSAAGVRRPSTAAGSDGRTALMAAAFVGRRDVLEALLAAAQGTGSGSGWGVGGRGGWVGGGGGGNPLVARRW